MVNIVRRVVLFFMAAMVAGWLFPDTGSTVVLADGPPDDLMARVSRLVVAGELHAERLTLLVELGRALGPTNPRRAVEVLEAVQRQLDLAGAADAQLTGKRLEHAFLWGGAEDKGQARIWTARLDAIARPVSLLVDLAEAWLPLDRARAEEVIRQAIPLVRRNPRSMDFELRMLSGLAVAVNGSLAESLVTAIGRPEIRSWAYRNMGQRLCSQGKTLAAAAYYGLALQSAARVGDPLQRVLTMVHVAEAWSGPDPKQGELVFDEAARLVSRIEKPEVAAYALSRLGAAWGRTNARKAMELASSIPPEYHEDRLRIYMEVAEAAKGGHEERGLLEEAHGEASHLALNHERERALGRLVQWMAPLDLDRAQEILLELGPGSDFVRDDALQVLALSAAAADVPRAVDLASQISDKFVKVTTLAFLAEKVYAIDETEGGRLLEAGQVEADALQKPGPQEALALAWTKYSGEKACLVAALVNGFANRARAYAKVAGRLKALGREAEAKRAWGLAMANAEKGDGRDELSQARTLKEIADLWAPWAPDQAEVVYEKVCRMTAG